MKQFSYDGDREIDLKQVVSMLWRNKSKIILIGFIIAALLVSIKAIITFPTINGDGKYTGTAKIYVSNDVPKANANAIDIYFKSNNLLNNAIRDLNLNLTVSDLSSAIKVDSSTSTLITLNVTGVDKTLVQNITDYLTAHGLKEIKNNFKYKSALIVDSAYTNIDAGIGWLNFLKKMIKYCVMGFLLGMGIAAAVYAFLYIHDNSIKDERDVYHYLGVPVLCTIPAIKGAKRNMDRNKKLHLFQNMSSKL